MWKSLRNLFESAISPAALKPRHEVAGIALLLEIARADHRHTDDELAAVEESVSLFEFTSTLNAHLDLPAKRQFLTHLWKVAFADGAVDHYEEYYLRKIADLLHVGHRGLIQAKLAAEDS
jgi:uncharacterized tellurite resistance protein B-like protein